MSAVFDFVVVGGGSAGAVIAARLSEDPACRVALVEAGDRPPDVELMPVACAAMQLNPATDWMYTADPGKAGLGLNRGRVPVPATLARTRWCRWRRASDRFFVFIWITQPCRLYQPCGAPAHPYNAALCLYRAPGVASS